MVITECIFSLNFFCSLSYANIPDRGMVRGIFTGRPLKGIVNENGRYWTRHGLMDQNIAKWFDVIYEHRPGDKRLHNFLFIFFI